MELYKKNWNRLDMCYGAPKLLVSSIRERFDKFPKMLPKDTDKLYELSVVVNICFTSLFGTKGLLSDIVIR